LEYDTYFIQLKEAAQLHDKQRPSNRRVHSTTLQHTDDSGDTYEGNVHEYDFGADEESLDDPEDNDIVAMAHNNSSRLGNNNRASSGKSNGTFKTFVKKETWNSLSRSGKKLWTSLPESDRKLLTDPKIIDSTRMNANTHESSSSDNNVSDEKVEETTISAGVHFGDFKSFASNLDDVETVDESKTIEDAIVAAVHAHNTGDKSKSTQLLSKTSKEDLVRIPKDQYKVSATNILGWQSEDHEDLQGHDEPINYAVNMSKSWRTPSE